MHDVLGSFHIAQNIRAALQPELLQGTAVTAVQYCTCCACNSNLRIPNQLSKLEKGSLMERAHLVNGTANLDITTQHCRE